MADSTRSKRKQLRPPGLSSKHSRHLHEKYASYDLYLTTHFACMTVREKSCTIPRHRSLDCMQQCTHAARARKKSDSKPTINLRVCMLIQNPNRMVFVAEKAATNGSPIKRIPNIQGSPRPYKIQKASTTIFF